MLMDNQMDTLISEVIELKQSQKQLISKIDALVSMNTDLINANLKLVGEFRRQPEKQTDKKTDKKNDDSIYYGVDPSATVYIYGSTYNVKDKIKNLGGKWDKTNSRWVMGLCEEDDVLTVFPDIIKKQLSNKCLLED
jgi:hypothetical protein